MHGGPRNGNRAAVVQQDLLPLYSGDVLEIEGEAGTALAEPWIGQQLFHRSMECNAEAHGIHGAAGTVVAQVPPYPLYI